MYYTQNIFWRDSLEKYYYPICFDVKMVVGNTQYTVMRQDATQ